GAAAAGVDRRPDPAPAEPGAPRRFALDAGRAKLHLGWEPWTALIDGAAATVAWWTGRGV
ncbi:MAG: UDP-glucose 4-epimerase, partial [Acidimicrobiales bacterium]